jgi:hypothetical protein
LPAQTTQRRILATCLLVLLACVVASGCRRGRLPTIRFTSPFGHSNWVGLEDARVIDGDAQSLAVTVSNRKSHPIWVRFEIDQLEGWNDCANSFKLIPGASHLYICPQTSISVGNRYRAELVVYKDLGNTKPTERITRSIEIHRDESGALVLDGRPAD